MSSSTTRERELARLKYERQQARRVTQSGSRKRRNQVVAVLAAFVLVSGAVIGIVVSSSSNDPTLSASATPSTTASATAVAGCTTAPTPTTKTQTWKKFGGTPLKAATDYVLTLETNCGKIEIAIDPKAPKTAQSEIFLAAQGYYENADCSRITVSAFFVLQCGSPTNDSKGDPGYTVPDENLPKSNGTNYPAGTVAMANAGKGTGGSQFFIVYKDTTLPANYSIWGKVVSGLDVVTKVAAAGVKDGSSDGAPTQPIVITKATTSEIPRVG